MMRTHWTALIVTLALSAAPSGATEKTFTGGNGDFDVPANWSPSGVPGAGDRIIIESGDTRTVNGDFTADSMEVQMGGEIVVAEDVTFQYASFSSTGVCTNPYDAGDGGCDQSPYEVNTDKGDCIIPGG